jgi:2'-5' RNA ligase
MTPHQLKQKEIIDEMNRQARHKALNFTYVTPVDDYVNDLRVGLTSVHIPNPDFVQTIQTMLIEPLKAIDLHHFYYQEDMFHITLKVVKDNSNPPRFTEENIQVAKDTFAEVVPQHRAFNIYFYKLIVFPTSLSLVGTTDPEFDDLFLDLNNKLKMVGLPDEKRYLNSKYFFCTLTLCRFKGEPSDRFLEKVDELKSALQLPPYTVDSVTLVTCNAVFQKRNILGEWSLQ